METGISAVRRLCKKNADGSYCADLRYVSCEVCKGKYQIPGLPAAYDETGAESETLKVYLEDAPGGVRVTLLYGVFAELDIITRAVQITNCGTEAVHVEKAASAALDFMTGEFDVIHFHGRHGWSGFLNAPRWSMEIRFLEAGGGHPVISRIRL